MLKQIKTLGLVVVIGSMIINSFTNISFADNKPKTNQELAISIYTEKHFGDCNKLEEYAIKYYLKNEELKAAAEKLNKENTILKEQGYHPDTMIDLIEIFPLFEHYSEEHQEIIEFVFRYYYNKATKFENTVKWCPICGKNYITNKETFIMYGEDTDCGCSHKLEVPELTYEGLKVALIREYTRVVKAEVEDIRCIQEDDKTITVEVKLLTSLGSQSTRIKTYDKITRTEIK